MKSWKVLNSKYILDSEYGKVRVETVELPNGKIIDDYYLWQIKDVAVIVTLTSDKKFLLTKQYKHGAGKIVIEFPAGYINQGENPKSAAQRELSEETGYVSTDLKLLSILTNDATKETSKIYLFLAKNATKKTHVSFDEAEDISLLLKDSHEIIQMIRDGQIYVSASVTGAYMALNEIGLLVFSDQKRQELLSSNNQKA